MKLWECIHHNTHCNPLNFNATQLLTSARRNIVPRDHACKWHASGLCQNYSTKKRRPRVVNDQMIFNPNFRLKLQKLQANPLQMLR